MSLSKRLINSNDTGGGGGASATLAFFRVNLGSSGKITSVDISDPNNIIPLDIDTDTDFQGVDNKIVFSSDKDYIFAPGGTNKIMSERVSIPSNLFTAQEFVVVDDLQYCDLDTSNNTLYATATNTGIYSYDVSDPTNISFLDNYSNSSQMQNTRGIRVDSVNQIAYVVSNPSFNSTILSFDISNPSSISFLDSINLGSVEVPYEIELDLVNNVAYVSESTNEKLIAVNISNPSNMSILGSYQNGTYFFRPANMQIDTTNNILYAGNDSRDAISALDISDPTNISLISQIVDTTNLREPIIRLDPSLNIIWSACGGDRLTAVDVSDPSNMSIINSYQDGNYIDSANDFLIK